jgi:hypothetical protein
MDCLIKTKYFHELNYKKFNASIKIFNFFISKLGELQKNPK